MFSGQLLKEAPALRADMRRGTINRRRLFLVPGHVIVPVPFHHVKNTLESIPGLTFRPGKSSGRLTQYWQLQQRVLVMRVQQGLKL
jgi:hypothetical protein